MRVIIFGCRENGVDFAKMLENLRYDVVIIEDNRTFLKKLDKNFKGTILPEAISYMDSLEHAKVETADMLVAMTSSDNFNIMICQIAKNMFGVRNVIALVSDTKKASFYEKLSIKIVKPSNNTLKDLSIASIGKLDESEDEYVDKLKEFMSRVFSIKKRKAKMTYKVKNNTYKSIEHIQEENENINAFDSEISFNQGNEYISKYIDEEEVKDLENLIQKHVNFVEEYETEYKRDSAGTILNEKEINGPLVLSDEENEDLTKEDELELVYDADIGFKLVSNKEAEEAEEVGADSISAQEEAEDVEADLISAQEEIEDIEADLISAQEEIEDVEADLISAQEEIEDVEADLISAQEEEIEDSSSEVFSPEELPSQKIILRNSKTNDILKISYKKAESRKRISDLFKELSDKNQLLIGIIKNNEFSFINFKTDDTTDDDILVIATNEVLQSETLPEDISTEQAIGMSDISQNKILIKYEKAFLGFDIDRIKSLKENKEDSYTIGAIKDGSFTMFHWLIKLEKGDYLVVLVK